MNNYLMILYNNITNKEVRVYFDAYGDEILPAIEDKLELTMIAEHTRSLEILCIKQIGFTE